MPLKEKIDRYLSYNQERKQNAIKFNEIKAVFLFNVVPFLLHANFKDLPGYIDDKGCPFGIHLFRPQKVINKDLFQRYFPNSTAMRKGTSPFSPHPAIHALTTIGSIGTIAQTEKSDCDYWVIVKFAELSAAKIKLLEQKCQGIEQWADSCGFEIHLFLMDIKQTRENSFASRAEDESAGSAMKLLLKDELFRTHILVAGKILLWWLIPPDLTDAEYKDYVRELPTKQKLNISHFIDLGYIPNIPREEIFGACLWQMNKALGSPFKSVIKFAYLEMILSASGQKQSPLVSDTIKRLLIFPELLTAPNKPLEPGDIDPYLLLARDIMAFYQTGDTEGKRAQFIQVCLFLKTLEGMDSQKRSKHHANHLQSTMALMEDWHLLPSPIDHYLNFKYWKYKNLVSEGVKVHDYLIATYKRLRWHLRNLESEGVGTTITGHDIAVLGRKLFTFHQKKENKVAYIQSLSRDIMAQVDITLHVTRADGRDVFFALQGDYDYKTIKANKDSLIKRETHLIRLLTGMIINGVLTAGTHLHLTKNYLPVDLSDIQALAAIIIQTFPLMDVAHISAEQLLDPEITTQALAIVNFAKNTIRGSKTLNSTIITVNSYGEYFIRDYKTLAQYKSALLTLLTQHEVSRWNKNFAIFIPPQKDLHALQTMLNA
ncbi:MAG: adenylate cyclase [Deltaproteobacteria bacterium]|nr:adenylate cyclase [Deltaproteobacteria bacterium]